MAENTLTTASGIFKDVYGDLKDKTPDGRYLCKDIPSGKGTSTGGDYKVPQTLTSEQGYTKAPPNSTAYALESPSAGAIKYATYQPYQFSLRVAYSTEAIERSSEGKEVFVALTKKQTKNAMKTAYAQMEQDILWGQSTGGIGITGVIATTTATITTETYAPGLWWGAEGRKDYFYSAAGVLRGTAIVTDYAIEARTVTYDIDLTTIGCVAGDIIYNSGSANQMIGMDVMFRNTTGTIFGINSTTYNLWRPGAAYDVAGALSFNKLFAAVTQGYNRGLGDDTSEFDVIINPRAWNNLNQDAAAIRTTDYSYKENSFENGHEVLKFFTNAGTARIIAHKMMKEGQGFIMPRVSESFEKLGAVTVPKFGLKKGGEYLRQMENNEGYESRIYWNAAIATDYMSQLVLMTGIVNS